MNLNDLPKVTQLGRRREGVEFSLAHPAELAASQSMPSSS